MSKVTSKLKCCIVFYMFIIFYPLYILLKNYIFIANKVWSDILSHCNKVRLEINGGDHPCPHQWWGMSSGSPALSEFNTGGGIQKDVFSWSPPLTWIFHSKFRTPSPKALTPPLRKPLPTPVPIHTSPLVPYLPPQITRYTFNWSRHKFI